jgi:4'-phosphopantetheinyl transferase
VNICHLLAWHMPPPDPDFSLPPDTVHVWRTPLSVPAEIIQHYTTILSPIERRRAQRFVFEHDRHRWTIARATLRLILARYLHTRSDQFDFSLNEFGKPSLAHPHAAGIEFNLSHSNEWALYAFVRHRLVGIDIEYMRNDLDFNALARQSFSPQENTVLRTLTGEDKMQAFFRGWTSKEAFAKALGKGFSQAFDHFTVEILPSRPPALLHQEENTSEPSCWSFISLDAAPGYAATLVVEGDKCPALGWTFEGAS